VFHRESPTMLPPGLSTDRGSCLRFGGFLSWAAKPSVRESPDPAMDIGYFRPDHPCWPSTPQNYVYSVDEVPNLKTFLLLSLDDA